MYQFQLFSNEPVTFGEMFQLQQLQQLQAQQEQAGGALTLTLQHQHSAGAGCLAPQLVLAPPHSFAYPVPQCGPSVTTCVHQLSGSSDTQSSPIIQHIGHTSILQSSIQHHVRQSSIQQVIQQVGQTSIQQVGVGVGSQGMGVGSKCVSVNASPGSPFSSRSLTPSPQQRVVTPQPHQLTQVVGTPGQVLQIFHHQQATRNTMTGTGVNMQSVKPKQPPQILPKPPGSGGSSQVKVSQSNVVHNSSPQITTLPQQQQGTLVFNQMLPSGPVLVQQQSSGVQLILRSPPPPQAPPKSGSIVLSANGGLTPQGTVVVQGRQQAQQVVRLITGQSLQLQQIQTSSGPTLIAVPSLQPSPAPPSTNQPQQSTTIRTVTAPSPTLIKKSKKKKKKEEEPRLDLANLMKLSGIEDEDVAPVSLAQPSQHQQQTQTTSHPQQQQYVHSPSPRLVVTPPRPNTPKQQQSQLLAQLQAPSQCANQGLRLSLGEDGRMVVHTTTTQGTTGVTPTVAALARNQLAQLLAGRGGQILQNNNSVSNSGSNEAAYLQSVQTAVFNLGGAEGLVMKGDGMALGTPSVVFNTGVRRPTHAPTSVVVANPSLIDSSQQNGVRIMTDINGISLPQQSQSGQNRIQIVPNSAVALTEHQNRVQIVSGVSNASALSLTEHQNRVQIVSGVPSSNAVSLTEQQNRVQIVSGVQSSNAMSLTEHQNRVQIVSGVPSSPAMSLTEHQNRVQIVSGVPSSNAMSLTEQQNRVQIVSSVPSSTTMSLTEQQNRLHFVSSVPSSTTMSLTEQQNRVHFVSSVPSSTTMSLTEQQNRVQIVSGVPSSPAMSLSEQQNRVQIVSGVQNSTGMSLSEQQNRIVVSSAPSTTSMSLTEQQNRVQIVSGIPNSNTMSLTEQNRVQIVSGTQASLTEQQNRVQIVSGMPSASTMSLTEQQNRVQIVAGVQSSNSMSLTEQQNRVQIVSAIPSSNSVALSEQNRVQIVSGIPNSNTVSMNEQNRVQIVSAVPNSSGISLEQQNRVQILSGCHNSSSLSLTEQQNRVQILSGVSSANTMSLTEQQNRVQIIQGVSNSNSMSLTEQQNRVQIVSGVPNSSSLSLTEQQNRVQIVAGMPNTSNSLSLSEQQNSRVQIVSGMANSSAISINDQNRVHIVSGRSLGEQQNRVHLMSGIQTSNNASMTEQSNRVQVVSGVPNRTTMSLSDQNRLQLLSNVSSGSSMSLCDQNRIHITPNQQTMPITDHQNRIQVVSGIQNSSHLLNDHNRVQIVAGVPNNALSEQGRIQLLSNSTCNDHNTVSVVTNPSEQTRVQLVTSLPNSISEQRVQIVTSMPSDHGRLSLVTTSAGMPLNDQQRFHIVTSLPSSNSFSDQRVHIVTSMANSMSFNDRIKNSYSEQQRHQQNSGVQTIEHVHRLQPQHSSKPQNKSPHMQQCSQSVNSPRCNPSPQSPRSGGASKSPVVFPSHSPVGSPQQQSHQPTRSPFPNRPNLTVVTQSQPSYHQSTPTSLHSNQSTDNSTLVNSYQQFPTAPKVVSTASHLNHQTETVNHPSVITSLANCQAAPTKPLQAVTRQPPRPATNNSSYQNSFLESIAQSHPSLVINKSPTPPVASKVFKPKKQPKKSAVVKPMMLEERQGTQTTGTSCEKEQEPPSLVPISSQCDSTQSTNMVQRVQTIQLTPQKQQHLKLVQNQISVLSNKKSRTPGEQSTLQRLFVEQQKILFSGKLIPTVPGQHAQGITFVSTPVRVLPTPASSPRTFPPSAPILPTASKATSPLHVQVGTQTTCEPSPSPPVATYSAPTQYPNRAAMIEQQLRKDRTGATAPDCNTPFASTSDACKRLVRYHCLDEPLLSHRDLEKADEIFEATARHFLDKKTQMLNKYSYLLLMESMRQVQTSELIMLGRMFVSDETTRLEHLRQEAQAPLAQHSVETTQNHPAQFNPHTSQHSNTSPAITAIKREREDSDEEEGEVKKHCPDDEEINAQVQNAIDSILNLQKSDPALDEAVRSILTS